MTKSALSANSAIRAAYLALRKLPKDDLIRRYPTRLDRAHLRAEPKEVLISDILEAEFGRRALDAWNGK